MYLSKTLFNRGAANLNQARQLAAAIGLERLCLGLMNDALTALEEGALYLFDPSIGDQWCEARASLVLEIAGGPDAAAPRRFHRLRRALARQAAGLERLDAAWQDLTSRGGPKHHRFCLEIKRRPLEVLTVFGIEPVAVTAPQKFLALSYFLKRYYSLYRNPVKLQALAVEFHQSASGIESIIKYARRHINEETDQYLDRVSRRVIAVAGRDDRLPIAQRRRYRDYGILCSRPRAHQGLRKRAVYPGTKILLADLWSRDVPILLNAKVVLSDHAHASRHRLYVADPGMPFVFRYAGRLEEGDRSWLDRHAFVIEAVSDPLALLPPGVGAVALTELLDGMHSVDQPDDPLMLNLEDRLDRLGLDRLVSLNTARHPQFLEDGLEPDYSALDTGGVSMSRECHALRDQAERIGCCVDNMATLRIYHMFADRPATVANRRHSTVWAWGK